MKQIRTSLLLLIVMTLLLGFAYPLAITGAARLFFKEKAGGSLIRAGGKVVGSKLVGQHFSKPGYFHGRPSANNYDGMNSGGSNLGPTNRKLIKTTTGTIGTLRNTNSLPPDAKIPADLVLASASGLDPHISLNAALLQSERIANARGIEKKTVDDLIAKNTERPYFKTWGTSYINVLKLNMALDAYGGNR